MAILQPINEIIRDITNQICDKLERRVDRYMEQILKEQIIMFDTRMAKLSKACKVTKNDLPELLSFKLVYKLTGLCRTSVWRKEKNGNFPKRVALGGGRKVAWRKEEVYGWIRSREALN